MLILTAEETRQALPMRECIAAMKKAFIALSAGEADLPLRSRLSIPQHEGTSLFMPAYLASEEGASLAVKIVSVFNRNPVKGLPLIHAAVLVLNEETGQVEALIEGGSLTAIRTGAGSGAATDQLARADAKRLAIIGAGVQAATQTEAVCAVREIEEVRVYAPNTEQVQAFIQAHRGKGHIPEKLIASSDASKALLGADIVCTATTSTEPVFADADLAAGCHINAVGSYTPEMCEIPMESLGRARIYVGSLQAAGAESGEIVQGQANGAIKTEALIELGQALADTSLGRQSTDEVTLFKSVGVAVQDAAAGRLALENARKMGLGQEISL